MKIVSFLLYGYLIVIRLPFPRMISMESLTIGVPYPIGHVTTPFECNEGLSFRTSYWQLHRIIFIQRQLLLLLPFFLMIIIRLKGENVQPLSRAQTAENNMTQNSEICTYEGNYGEPTYSDTTSAAI